MIVKDFLKLFVSDYVVHIYDNDYNLLCKTSIFGIVPEQYYYSLVLTVKIEYHHVFTVIRIVIKN